MVSYSIIRLKNKTVILQQAMEDPFWFIVGNINMFFVDGHAASIGKNELVNYYSM